MPNKALTISKQVCLHVCLLCPLMSYLEHLCICLYILSIDGTRAFWRQLMLGTFFGGRIERNFYRPIVDRRSFDAHG